MFDATRIPLLGKALDAYALRQKVSAANIANITTPGYRSKVVSFEQELAGAMSGSHISGSTTNEGQIAIGASSLAQVTPKAQDAPASSNDIASGYNDVDIDVEMAELAKNQIRVRYAARLLSNTFREIQQSIRGTV
jgi:flagellar basal-body rod protein FlgB